MTATETILGQDERAAYDELARRAAASPIRDSRVFAWVMDPVARPLRRERSWLMHLDDRLRFARLTELHRGETDEVIVCKTASCVDVGRIAHRAGEPFAVLAHNHPSGKAWPSDSDAELVAPVARALERVGVRLLDHVILGHGEHYSFTEGQLWQRA